VYPLQPENPSPIDLRKLNPLLKNSESFQSKFLR
jgi:hypothetical protein